MFHLDAKQLEKLAAWVAEQDAEVARRQGRDEAYYGATGGALTYCFAPTSLGTVVVVKNEVTKQTIDLTEYGDW